MLCRTVKSIKIRIRCPRLTFLHPHKQILTHQMMHRIARSFWSLAWHRTIHWHWHSESTHIPKKKNQRKKENIKRQQWRLEMMIQHICVTGDSKMPAFMIANIYLMRNAKQLCLQSISVCDDECVAETHPRSFHRFYDIFSSRYMYFASAVAAVASSSSFSVCLPVQFGLVSTTIYVCRLHVQHFYFQSQTAMPMFAGVCVLQTCVRALLYFAPLFCLDSRSCAIFYIHTYILFFFSPALAAEIFFFHSFPLFRLIFVLRFVC